MLSSIDEIDFGNNKPKIAIMPLGTGNDLSRTFNWGGRFYLSQIEHFLNSVVTSSSVQLDR